MGAKKPFLFISLQPYYLEELEPYYVEPQRLPLAAKVSLVRIDQANQKLAWDNLGNAELSICYIPGA